MAKSANAADLADKGRSSIDTSETGKISEEAASLLGVFDTLKTRSGPVSSALNRAAERIADGEPKAKVVRETRAEIARQIEQIFKPGG